MKEKDICSKERVLDLQKNRNLNSVSRSTRATNPNKAKQNYLSHK